MHAQPSGLCRNELGHRTNPTRYWRRNNSMGTGNRRPLTWSLKVCMSQGVLIPTLQGHAICQPQPAATDTWHWKPTSIHARHQPSGEDGRTHVDVVSKTHDDSVLSSPSRYTVSSFVRAWKPRSIEGIRDFPCICAKRQLSFRSFL